MFSDSSCLCIKRPPSNHFLQIWFWGKNPLILCISKRHLHFATKNTELKRNCPKNPIPCYIKYYPSWLWRVGITHPPCIEPAHLYGSCISTIHGDSSNRRHSSSYMAKVHPVPPRPTFQYGRKPLPIHYILTASAWLIKIKWNEMKNVTFQSFNS